MLQNHLIEMIKLISKFMTSQPSKQTIIIHVLLNNLRSKQNQGKTTQETILLKSHTQNVVEKLVPYFFLKG